MVPKVSLALGGISISGVAVGAGFGIHHLTKEKQEGIKNSRMARK